MNEINLFEYELAKSLTLNFFYSHYYLTFDNIEDVEEFLQFINANDHRYNKDFIKKQEIKSVMWKYTNISHRHQLEWQNETVWFGQYGAEPLEYKKIKPYIKEVLHFRRVFNTTTEEDGE